MFVTNKAIVLFRIFYINRKKLSNNGNNYCRFGNCNNNTSINRIKIVIEFVYCFVFLLQDIRIIFDFNLFTNIVYYN